MARAFTLIELLVVIAIVAVLAGMLMPAIASVRAAAHSSACASNQRQLVLALVSYSNDWEGLLPYSQIDAACVPGWMVPGTKSWTDQDRVGSYLDGSQLAGGAFLAGKPRSGVWRCQSDNRVGGVHWFMNTPSYGLNRQLCAAIASPSTAADAELAMRSPRSLGQLRCPDRLLLTIDTQEARWIATNFPGPTTPPTLAYSRQDLPSAFAGSSVQAPYSQFGRHRGAANAAFADGHVAILPTLKDDVLQKRLFARLEDIP